MRKLYILTFSVLTLFTYNVFGVNSGDSQKNVLIICALAPTTPAYKPILDGIRQELYRSFNDSCNLRVEYLETERYPADQYPPEKLSLVVAKYNNVNLDLLAAGSLKYLPVMKKANFRFTVALRNSSQTRTGVILFFSLSTFMATMAQDWGPVNRPDGVAWWLRSYRYMNLLIPKIFSRVE